MKVMHLYVETYSNVEIHDEFDFYDKSPKMWLVDGCYEFRPYATRQRVYNYYSKN